MGGQGRNIRRFCEVENKYTTQGGAAEKARIFRNPVHRREDENEYTSQGGAAQNARISTRAVIFIPIDEYHGFL